MEVEINPSAEDLIAIIALVQQESDLLRERIGSVGIRFHRRLFSHEDILRGRALSPQASCNCDGSISFKLES